MKDWVVKSVFEKKTKLHVTEILDVVLRSRATGEEPDQVEVPNLPKSIALVSCPAKEDVQP